VRLLVDGAERGQRDVGVYLRGVEFGVSEHLLHEADVRAVLVHVGGAAVPQQVAAAGLFDPGRLEALPHHVAHGVGTEPLPVAGEGQGLFADFAEQLLAATVDVVTQPLRGARAHRDEAGLAAFAVAHVDQAVVPIEVAQIEQGQLAAAHPGRVEQFEQGFVPQARRL